ncbi:MAG TPA: energy transducer TonB [Pyrinomonadaceae bacterium]|nr:energy transducer TonB [Pyrinomonadaceae bacterium]
MKFCPTCQTRYDEEILRFCTKDGTPLVEEDQPAFTALPSEESDDDFGEETVIRRNPSASAAPVAETVSERTQPLAPQPRIVIPTVEEKKTSPPARTKTVTEYQVQPRKSNTAKIVLLTLLGVIGALGAAVLLIMMSRSNDDGNAVQNNNVNTNFNSIDTNLNTNLDTGDSLMNFNSGINENNSPGINLSANINTNIKTPTPTPTPKPTASASATPPPLLNTNINVGNSNAPPLPTPAAPRPTATPILPPPPPPARPTPSDTPDASRPVNAGVLNGRAVNLPKPAYPPIARQMGASGQVAVQILIDESGNVKSAKATSGNALLRAPAEAAARQSKINPVKIGDRNVQAVGILLYNFVNP